MFVTAFLSPPTQNFCYKLKPRWNRSQMHLGAKEEKVKACVGWTRHQLQALKSFRLTLSFNLCEFPVSLYCPVCDGVRYQCNFSHKKGFCPPIAFPKRVTLLPRRVTLHLLNLILCWSILLLYRFACISWLFVTNDTCCVLQRICVLYWAPTS